MAGGAQEPTNGSKRYGKRPLWQWVLLYVIIGGLIYLAIYYFYMRNHNTNLYGRNSGQSQSATSGSVPPVNNAVLTTKTDAKLGQYLADPEGHALYTYSSDSNGVSSCTGSCIAIWPAYQDSGTTTGLPAGVATIKRTDNGETQFTYNGMPLYTFASDGNGQVTGNGVSDFVVAKPVANPVTNATSTSTAPSSSSDSSSSSGSYSW